MSDIKNVAVVGVRSLTSLHHSHTDPT
jgi:nucleoside-diphosphate-sugar epimerase